MEQQNYEERIAQMSDYEYARAYFTLHKYLPKYRKIFIQSLEQRQEFAKILKIVKKQKDLSLNEKIQLAVDAYENGLPEEKYDFTKVPVIYDYVPPHNNTGDTPTQQNYEEQIDKMSDHEYARVYFKLDEYEPEFQELFQKSLKRRPIYSKILRTIDNQKDLITDEKIRLASYAYEHGLPEEYYTYVESTPAYDNTSLSSYTDDTRTLRQQKSKDLHSFNGCGTTHLGKYNKNGNEYDTVCWFVLLDIPIIPYEAYRIKVIEESKDNIKFWILHPVKMKKEWITTEYLKGFIKLVVIIIIVLTLYTIKFM